MNISITPGKLIGVGVAVLTLVGGVVTTALIITSNATQGSLNRLDNRVIALGDKVTDNTVAIANVGTQLGILIAKMDTQQDRVARDKAREHKAVPLTTAFVK